MHEVLEELAAVKQRDEDAECVNPACHQASADRRFLLELLAGEESMRRSASQQARKLMDEIRDDPAFPPEDDEMLFGDRAITVIRKLYAENEEYREAYGLPPSTQAALHRIGRGIARAYGGGEFDES